MSFQSMNTDNKTFSTPLRPLSNEQIHSLREKISKESPSLYRNKVLTDPIKSYRHELINNGSGNQGTPSSKLRNLFQNVNIDKDYLIHQQENLKQRGNNGVNHAPSKEKTNNFNSNDLLNEDENLQLSTIMESSNLQKEQLLGNYENPILSKLSQRTVNKELELQKVIFNVIFLTLGNLSSKFFNFFINHTKFGKLLLNQLKINDSKKIVGHINPTISNDNKFLYYLKFCVTSQQKYFPFINFENVKFLIQSILIVNIIISLWNLTETVKTDDLKLNDKQKQLLGLNSQKKNSKDKHTSKPHLVYTNQKNLIQQQSQNNINGNSSANKNSSNKPTPPTPFLFKSLETPLKFKDRNEPKSVMVNQVDAFGNPRKNFLSSNVAVKTPASAPPSSSGYIPSNRYAYLMDSPSPRKRL
ncbi:hypothetical protein Kpol_2002p101 [Vanderwaltozyma polyspora DSM 70294]|uniref:Uncharacterized protein n=1 Tax=Vanderwaltozyma polyspora (strain ATCC 22028 / DSM 70294 / BCRC 21397 / CBS 2163 / NBRC 10782 / NRRL Y-8283 / UCD 57-17) TaxID=436907 RepID=A7TFL5_VANPO|nr:uncharacterized protein Kpol_2002p101 [Vanderwaltozyma polyspora DSM 70294]EDO19029.1 hypothetical protein Kpol_2002p101 [Vanderwaltozyma polyspora DSM 70294]